MPSCRAAPPQRNIPYAQVNLKLFAPEPDRKKTVLLFVIRDKTKTPLAKLTEVLEADLDRMWDSIAKPAAYSGSKMTDFFEVWG